MEHKRIIEVFTAGCPLCAPTVDLVKSMAGSSYEVIVYDLSKPCDTQVCIEKARQYGVKSLPAVAVNSVLLDGYQNQGVSLDHLTAAGLGSLTFA